MLIIYIKLKSKVRLFIRFLINRKSYILIKIPINLSIILVFYEVFR